MSYSNFNTFKLFQNVGINSSSDYMLSMRPNDNNVSFHSSNSIDYNNVDIMSIKNIINKAPNEDLNLSSLNGTTINPVITINNNNQDCRIMTNLNVSGNLNVINDVTINTRLGIGTTSLNNGFTSSNVHTNSILDINGQTTIRGHILPSQNAQFDLGNAEYKIRHLFLSDNSLWIGDEHKIDISSGKIKFKKRDKTKAPKKLNNEAITLTDVKSLLPAERKNEIDNDISKVKLSEWYNYADSIGIGTTIFTSNDTTIWTEDKEIGGASFFQASTSGYGSSEVETIANAAYTWTTFRSGIIALSSLYNCQLVGGENNFQVKLGGSRVAFWTGFSSGYAHYGNGTNTVTLINKDVGTTNDVPPMGKDFPLQIFGGCVSGFARYTGTDNDDWGGMSRTRYYAGGTSNYGSYAETYISIWCEYEMYATGYLTSSDERLKTNIVDVPDDIALKQIRDIGCKYYNYKDPLQSSKKMIGFIAQNVKNVYPEAVTQTLDYIPNILKKITNLSWTETIKTNNEGIEETVFIMTTNDFSMNGSNYKFYVSDTQEEKEKSLCIVKNNDNTFTFEKKWNYVYCYGYEVDDSLSIEYDKIFVLHHSAIQEIDKQQLVDKQKIETLETKISTLEIENQQQQTKISELTSIMDKLKTANSFEEFKQTF